MRPSPSCPAPVGSNDRVNQAAVALLDGIQEAGFTPTQFRILLAIHVEGLSSPGAIAQKLKLSASGVSEALGRLLKRRQVTRERDSQNDRLVRYGLTPATVTELDVILKSGRTDDQA